MCQQKSVKKYKEIGILSIQTGKVMQQDITITEDFLKLLPDSDTVFAAKDSFLAKHLLPLISIDLA